MAALLIVAHAPLASALAAVARHPGLHPEAVIEAVDVPPQLTGPDEVCALVQAALLRMGQPQVLVLTDVYAASPCNGTLLAAEGIGVRVVSGVNVPMLWKALGRIAEPLDELTRAAVAAGQQGVMSLPTAPRQP